jgi:hypothetical protein
VSSSLPVKPKRLRFAWLAIITGVLGAVLLSLSMSGTMSGFVASITNSTNNATSGTLVMQETGTGANPVTCSSTDGGSVSTNTATCSTINKFGGQTMYPGQTVNTAVSIKNAGSVTANTATLAAGSTCTSVKVGSTSGTATDLCAKMNLVITNTATSAVVYSGTIAGLGTATTPLSLGTASAGSSTTYNFAVTLASTADNTYQGLQASMPLVWTYAS